MSPDKPIYTRCMSPDKPIYTRCMSPDKPIYTRGMVSRWQQRRAAPQLRVGLIRAGHSDSDSASLGQSQVTVPVTDTRRLRPSAVTAPQRSDQQP